MVRNHRLPKVKPLPRSRTKALREKSLSNGDGKLKSHAMKCIQMNVSDMPVEIAHSDTVTFPGFIRDVFLNRVIGTCTESKQVLKAPHNRVENLIGIWRRINEVERSEFKRSLGYTLC